MQQRRPVRASRAREKRACGACLLEQLPAELLANIAGAAGIEDGLALALVSTSLLQAVQGLSEICTCDVYGELRQKKMSLPLGCEKRCHKKPTKCHVCINVHSCSASVARIKWFSTHLGMPGAISNWPHSPGFHDNMHCRSSRSAHWPNVCTAAASQGRLDVLQYAYFDLATRSTKKKGKVTMDFPGWNVQNIINAQTCIAAAHAGELGVLKWAHGRGAALNFPFRWASSEPIDSERVLEDDVTSLEAYIPRDAGAAAASKGHLHILDWLLSHVYRNESEEMHPDTFPAAAIEGRLEVLEWASNHQVVFDIDFEMILEAALVGGQLEVLKWLREQRPEDWAEAATDVVQNKWWGRNVHPTAHIHSAHHPPNRRAVTNIALLSWLAEHCGLEFDEYACGLAAAYGQLSTLQWLRARDPPCPWNELTCRYAIAGDEGQPSIDVLRWAHDNGCPFGEDLVDFAGRHIDLDFHKDTIVPILTYLKEHDAPHLDDLCPAASEFANLRTLKAAVALGYPFDEDECFEQALAGEYTADGGALQAGRDGAYAYQEDRRRMIDWFIERELQESCCDVACHARCIKPSVAAPVPPSPAMVWVCEKCNWCICHVCFESSGGANSRATRAGHRKWHGHPHALVERDLWG